MNYDFDKDITLGEEAEKQVLEHIRKKYPKAYKKQGYFKEYDLVVPEINKTIEVKRDFLAMETGNYFIETAYNKKPSGIETTTADFFVLVDDITAILCLTENLKYLIRDIKEYSYKPKGKDYERTGKLIRRKTLLHFPLNKILWHNPIS